MKNILLISLLLIVTLIPELKSQDTLKMGAKTIENVAPSENKNVQDSIFDFVDVNARFQNGDLGKFREWVQKNLVYPPYAVVNGIQGRIMVQFYINSDGKLLNARILRGVDSSLDKEVLRVVNLSPLWEPALIKGQPVKQQFVIPVIFALGN